jgi:hypothetical protein
VFFPVKLSVVIGASIMNLVMDEETISFPHATVKIKRHIRNIETLHYEIIKTLHKHSKIPFFSFKIILLRIQGL